MANVQLTELTAGTELAEIYYRMHQALGEKSDSSATYEDQAHQTRIVIEGEGFTYQNGAITSGTVEAVHFTNADGDDFAVATDLAINAAKISRLMTNTMPFHLMGEIFKHADIWTGSDIGDRMTTGYSGHDQLFGGGGDDFLGGFDPGRDTLTGGEGSDYFLLTPDSGHDVVTDFHANGDSGVHDFIQMSARHRIIDRGDDTLIRYDRHNSLLLLNVDSADITAEDFYDPRHPRSSSFHGFMHHGAGDF